MITAIRDVRLAKGMTLEEVARRCQPPSTPQQIGRLELGTRTVSVAWLNRLAAALDVTAVDLVRMPDRTELPVAARLDAAGARALRRPAAVIPPSPSPGLVAVTVAASIGDYRAGDEIWCRQLAPAEFATALHRDVLVPQPAGHFLFGRLLGVGDALLQLLPVTPGARPAAVPTPPWLARAERLVRSL